MALIEYDSYKQKLRELGPELEKLAAALDIESAKQEAARLEDETAQDGFWNDLERSQKVQMRLKQLQNKITRQEKLVSAWEDLTTLCEMGQEEDDADILEELKAEFAQLEEKVEETRMTTLLSGEYDNSNAILQFHAGAGGTEAQDWAQMLYPCTPAGPSATVLSTRSWTMKKVTRPVSSLPPSPSRARTPMAF